MITVCHIALGLILGLYLVTAFCAGLYSLVWTIDRTARLISDIIGRESSR